jgi:ribulose-phosphate 3-epimerase
MIEIIPAILVDNFEELREKIKSVNGFVDRVQIDVMDGKFVNNITWNNPKELKSLAFEIDAKMEVHLMIESPWDHIDDWLESGVKRIIFHIESFNCDFERVRNILKKIKNHGIETSIALNPKTSWKTVEPFIENIDVIFMMTVEPGFGSQKFIPDVLNKIADFKKKFPEKDVEVDGGICVGVAKEAVKAGADILAAGSFIFKHPEGVEKAIAYLKEDAKFGLAKSVVN